MKIETPTPSGHAFILRRFDTGAISLTTMFRAAFPTAPDHEEKSELQWVKENFDLTGNNGGPQSPQITRLAGTWVSPVLARTLGDTYALGDLITAVIEASPDPNGNYRRSGKANAGAQTKTPAVTQAPLPSSTFTASPLVVKNIPASSPQATPNPAKRRKERGSSPPARSPSPPSSPSKIPMPRRSSRTRSPAPKTFPSTTVKTPKSTSKASRREEVKIVTPSSDLTVVDEESVVIEDGITGSALHQEDVTDQKALIEKLKAQRAQQQAAQAEVEQEEEGAETPVSESILKRAREEDNQGFKFEFKEPEVGERAIATNSRVERLQPRTRRLAWGAAVFALGMGAAAFLPNFL